MGTLDEVIRFIRKPDGSVRPSVVTTNARIPSPLDRKMKRKQRRLNKIAAASRRRNSR